MSNEEIKKMEYLKNMMDNEVIYAAKIEDTDRNKNLIPRLVLTKIKNDGSIKGTFHTIADDTKKNSDKYDGNINVLCTTKTLKPGFYSWLSKVNYTIISEDTYRKYRIEATESSNGFKHVSDEIRNGCKSANINIKAVTPKIEKEQPSIASSYKGLRKDAVMCIETLAKRSNDYKNILDLLTTYDDIGLVSVYNAITGSGSITISHIKDGNIKCSDSQKKAAMEILEYEKKFLDLPIKGRRDYFNIALAFCYRCKEIDNDELYRKIKNKCKQMSPMKSIDHALSEIERIYNYRRGTKILIKQMYLYSK